MTLDEAIQHLEEKLKDENILSWGYQECYDEHKQLLEWLTKLKDLEDSAEITIDIKTKANE